jgi:peptidoglycan/xylan/chitin deacetylase (PgdA/CDA1 family)
MYHYVHDDERLPGPGLPSVPPGIPGLTSRDFKAQLDHLCRLMEPIAWPTLYAWLAGRGSIPNRCFLLTFDDGLADHANTVLPILQERRLRGVFFVPGAVLSAHRLLPAHAVHLLLAVLDEQTLERELLEYLASSNESGCDWVPHADPAAATRMYHYEPPARAWLKYLLTVTLPTDLRNGAVRDLFERHIGSPTRWARHWYMGWDELADMESSGHTIGGHGYCHEPYSRMTPPERKDDMRRVAMLLNDGLGPDPRPFSYPYGQTDNDTRAVCREAGFVHAFTTERRWVSCRGDVLSLPRVDTIDVGAMLEREEVSCIRQ